MLYCEGTMLKTWTQCSLLWTQFSGNTQCCSVRIQCYRMWTPCRLHTVV